MILYLLKMIVPYIECFIQLSFFLIREIIPLGNYCKGNLYTLIDKTLYDCMLLFVVVVIIVVVVVIIVVVVIVVVVIVVV